jgi:hypothetical protein
MKLQQFDINVVDLNDYYFIAHTLECVLVGKKCDSSYEKLLKRLKDDTVLELHLFNEEKEIFATRIDGKLLVYQELEHQTDQEGKRYKVVEREYMLDDVIQSKTSYEGLIVREYINFDENCLAYVDRTVLCKLIKKRVEK